MKTILVIYSNKVVNIKTAKEKRYAFNTADDVKVGDVIKSENYDTNMTVVKILDKSFKYYNIKTGEMTDEYNSSALYDIRTLKIYDADAEDVVTARRVIAEK